jgi:hypothetical protein
MHPPSKDLKTIIVDSIFPEASGTPDHPDLCWLAAVRWPVEASAS